MLRRQPPHSDPLNFLAGRSEMAMRIREFDWANHPLGRPERWPQSLKSALSICLHSAFPTSIYWGSELRLLYNDAWAPIPGPRHPAALGAPAREVWADIWHVLEPQFAQLIETGEGIYVRDQLLPMRRYGVLEETYWSYSFTPIRGEDGAIVGVFNSGSESTDAVLAQRRMRFLLELGEALRTTSEPHAGCGVAVEMLGQHLGVQRAGIGELHPRGISLEVIAEWAENGTVSLGRSVDLAPVADLLDATLRQGRVLRVNDVRQDPLTSAGPVRDTFENAGVRASLVVPRTEAGRLVANLFLHSAQPRIWTDMEIVLAEQVLDRTWRWIERERGVQRERMLAREIDHRARNTLAVVQSLVRQTRAASMRDLRDRIEDRIAALARTHNLLAEDHWSGVELGTLVEQELAPYIGGAPPRARFEGPSVPLTPQLAQSLALVLHELTTNAAKHGALNAEDGTLDVHWRTDDAGELVLDWRERVAGRSAPASEPRRKGFGSVLFGAVVERQLKGRVERHWNREGLECRLVLPLVQRSPTESAHGTDPVAAGQARPRVLLAEDEPIVALDVAAMLEDLGYELFAVCHTLDEAIAAVSNDSPDIALLDANLVGQSSLPLAEMLHARRVPVIFATGYQRLPELPESLSDAPILTKPLSRAPLVAALSGRTPAAF
jgi:two-component sensor histidine kinase/CheY-like chemotaxis protein